MPTTRPPRVWRLLAPICLAALLVSCDSSREPETRFQLVVRGDVSDNLAGDDARAGIEGTIVYYGFVVWLRGEDDVELSLSNRVSDVPALGTYPIVPEEERDEEALFSGSATFGPGRSYEFDGGTLTLLSCDEEVIEGRIVASGPSRTGTGRIDLTASFTARRENGGKAGGFPIDPCP